MKDNLENDNDMIYTSYEWKIGYILQGAVACSLH